LFLNTIWLTNKNALESFRRAVSRRRDLSFRSREIKLSSRYQLNYKNCKTKKKCPLFVGREVTALRE